MKEPTWKHIIYAAAKALCMTIIVLILIESIAQLVSRAYFKEKEKYELMHK